VAVEVCGFFLSVIHPLGIIWWSMIGTAIELLLGLLWVKLVLVCGVLLTVEVCGFTAINLLLKLLWVMLVLACVWLLAVVLYNYSVFF
jgi:hypothetical protein